MSEESKVVLKRLFDDILNGGKLEVLDEIVSSDFFNHSTSTGVTPDREGWRTSLGRLVAGFSEMRYEISDLIGEGEMASLRFVAQGVHQGNLFGAAPSGKRLHWAGHVHVPRGGREDGGALGAAHRSEHDAAAWGNPVVARVGEERHVGRKQGCAAAAL